MTGFLSPIDLIRDVSQNRYPLPPLVTSSVNAFTTAHLYWRSIKYYQIVRKAEQREKAVEGNAVVYGALIYGASQTSDVAKILLKIALVAKCAEDVIQCYSKVHKAYKNLKKAVSLPYPIYEKSKWSKQPQRLPFSQQMQRTQEQFLQVVSCMSLLVQELFELSMRLRDVYLLSKQDSLTQYTACVEGIANLNKYWSRITKDSMFLMNELKKHDKWARAIVDKVPENSVLTKLKASLDQISPHMPRNSKEIVRAAEEFVEPIYIPGKVTSMRLTFNDPIHQPTLPARRTPPWSGKKVVKASKQKPKTESITMQKALQAITKNPKKLFHTMPSLFSLFSH